MAATFGHFARVMGSGSEDVRMDDREKDLLPSSVGVVFGARNRSTINHHQIVKQLPPTPTATELPPLEGSSVGRDCNRREKKRKNKNERHGHETRCRALYGGSTMAMNYASVATVYEPQCIVVRMV